MSTWSSTRIAALAIMLGAALWPGSAVAAPAAASATQGACGTFSGPGWSRVDPMTGTALKGTAWKVIVDGVPCPYAKTQAKTLVKTPFRGEALTKLKSPKGWSCVPGGGYSGGGKGTSGSCNQGKKYFGWGPALPA